jgi:hypothetical protein
VKEGVATLCHTHTTESSGEPIMPEQPPDYITLLTQGPFPDRIDPWAEVGYYFQQIHSCMIHELLEQLQPRLLPRGYVAGIEATHQTVEPETDYQTGRHPRLPAAA